MIIYRGFRDFVGPYVAHCHNLAHEDHAMMFGWEITPVAHRSLDARPARCGAGVPDETPKAHHASHLPHRPRHARHRLPVSRWTVALFALVVTAADGFWATSLRGAIGYIEATQQPFRDWLLYLAVMLPIFGGNGVRRALARAPARRQRRGALRRWSPPCAVVLTTVIAIAQIGLTAIYDYRTQAHQQMLMHRSTTTPARSTASIPARPHRPATSTCTGLCSHKQQTLAAHVRAMRCGHRAAAPRTRCSCCGRWRSAAAGSGRARRTAGRVEAIDGDSAAMAVV